MNSRSTLKTVLSTSCDSSERTSPQGLMTPRLLRHSVDIHLASSLIKQNAELKRQLAALEYQNTLLLSDLPR